MSTANSALRREAHGTPSASVVAIEDSFEPLALDWDALADRAGAPPFLRPGWVAAWWRAFGRGSLQILTVRRKGCLAGVLPLYRRHGALRSTSNWHSPTFGSLAEGLDAVQELGGELFAEAPRRVSLAFAAREGRDLDLWQSAAAGAGYRVLVRTLERSPYVDIAGNWEAYRAGLSRNARQNLTRNLRRLRACGTVTLDVSDGSDRLDELLGEAFRLEAASWKGSRRTAIVSHSATRRFYDDVAHWAARRGWLRLVFLRVDGRAVAFHYALEEGRVYYPLKGGYDPAFRQFSPGTLIIQLTLERAFADGLARYELLGGAEPYKLTWTSSCRDSVLLHAFAPTLPGRLDWTVRARGRPLAKRARIDAAVGLFRR
jgi:CelD/BcsL family acetyltransferase involved in cellulose biosynthesis